MNAPDPVALALAADPTLALMSPAERRAEIAALLLSAGRDTEAEDPLTLALLVEEAEALDPPEPATVAPSVHLDPCREDRGDNCGETVAANGRCMACGARREAEAKAQAVEMPKGLLDEIGRAMGDLMTGTAVMLDGKRVDPADYLASSSVQMPAGLVVPPVPSQRAAPERLRTEGEPILARYKAVSNATAQEIGEAIGRGKSSVQAMVTSRYTEILSPEQIRTLADRAKAQAADLLAFAASMDALPNAEPDAN
jgi:hypothetical protein